MEWRDGERPRAFVVVDLSGEGIVAQGEPLVKQRVERAAGIWGKGDSLAWANLKY
jgi:hypothetical protein